MSSDVLSDVLAAIHLTGAVYFDFRVTAPWVAEAPPTAVIRNTVMPGAQRVIEYHLIAEGSCWVGLVGETPTPAREGDLVMFPQGDSHVLSSEPGMRASPDLSVYARASTPLPLCFQLGAGGGERGRIVCGFLGCDDRPYNPLLAALPRMIHIPAAAREPAAGWMAMLFKTAAHEMNRTRPGAENLLARISELVFVEAVRQHLETLSAEETGWLAALRDEVVSTALAALHARPACPWTVEQLARHSGVSRSVLAERFTSMVGQPPMQYLALWRMQLASRLLAEGRTVARVADAVGYESESAFSRTFKRLVGRAPSEWRDRVNA